MEITSTGVDLFYNPLERLQSEGWHQANFLGVFDLDKMIVENRENFVHSCSFRLPAEGDRIKWSWDHLYFRPSAERFVRVQPLHQDRAFLSVWAVNHADAKKDLLAWCEKYRVSHKRRQRPAKFCIVTMSGDGPSTESVEVVREHVCREHALALHYGEAFPQWAMRFTHRLKENRFGATILRGEPGTGKTSFLRYLIHKLRRTHRFYYLPVDCHEMITSPKMANFWIGENSRHAGVKKVVVMEDAESLLMERGGDNRASVSNMLNVADGLLGEFLRLHLICTINRPVKRLDPAITRSGRLLDYWQFRRLTAEEAHRLAEAKGLRLSGRRESYSLAEIYAGASPLEDNGRERTIGFLKAPTVQ
jgi:hypothetical protein